LRELKDLQNIAENVVPERVGKKAATLQKELELLKLKEEDLKTKQTGRNLRRDELTKGITFYKDR